MGRSLAEKYWQDGDVLGKRLKMNGLDSDRPWMTVVSFTGDYNTCAQTCPIQDHVISNMKGELQDKQLGLLRVSSDKASYYRADTLLKEAQLVLEATCRACDAGSVK